MPFIQNVAYADIPTAYHMDAGDRAMLIQIVDPGMKFPEPKAKFESRHQFEFLDVEENDKDSELFEEFSMKPSQAAQIIALLKQALEERRNVVVHCFAGICRSGAVAEVGIIMGFQDTDRYRQPNVWVKQLLMNELGWNYENEETSKETEE